MPLFLPCFIIFLIILTYFLRKNTKLEQETQEQFWEKERQANAARKKDIKDLPYLTIPLETFPLGKYSDSELSRLEQELSKLAETSILNLNGITNTDLKLNYGLANLDFLSECDENYTEMIRLLQDYGKRLFELSHQNDAETVLRYAVDSGSDICATYTLLADIYLAKDAMSELSSLMETVKNLNSARKDTILEKLNSKHPA